MKEKLNYQQLQRLTCSRSSFSVDDNISDTQPQKCDSPRDILVKYARGQQIVSLGEYYEDEDYTEEQMEETEIIDDEFDRLDYLREAAISATEAENSPPAAEKEKSETSVPPTEEKPAEG